MGAGKWPKVSRLNSSEPMSLGAMSDVRSVWGLRGPVAISRMARPHHRSTRSLPRLPKPPQPPKPSSPATSVTKRFLRKSNFPEATTTPAPPSFDFDRWSGGLASRRLKSRSQRWQIPCEVGCSPSTSVLPHHAHTTFVFAIPQPRPSTVGRYRHISRFRFAGHLAKAYQRQGAPHRRTSL